MKKRNAKVFAMFMTSVLTFTSMAPATVLAAEEEVVAAEVAEEATEEVDEEEGVVGEAAVLEEEDSTEEVAEETEAVETEAEVEDEELVGKIVSDDARELNHGFCGYGDTNYESATIQWKYMSDKTLILEAKGQDRDMEDYASYADTPWGKLELDIKGVEVQGEVNNIGEHAFETSNVEKVELSFYVKKVGKYAFANCESLKDVKFNDPSKAMIEVYDDSAFENCVNLVTITFTKDLQYINRKAFYNCEKLAVELSFDTNLKAILAGAFWGCKAIKTLYVPYSVLYIGGEATGGLSTTDAASSTEPETKLGAFANCTGLTEVTFQEPMNGEGIKDIDDFAFYGCIKLPNIELPTTLVHLGDYVFSNCTSLSTAVVNGTDMPIRLFGTFSRCTSLSMVTLGTWTWNDPIEKDWGWYESNITEIGYETFMDCTSLKKVVLSPVEMDECKAIGDSAFWRCQSLKKFDMPAWIESIGNYAFRNCYILDDVEVPDRVKTIGDNAFYNCVGMSNILLPTSITKIGAKCVTCDDDRKMTLVDVYFRGSETQWTTVLSNTDKSNVLLKAEYETIKANVYPYTESIVYVDTYSEDEPELNVSYEYNSTNEHIPVNVSANYSKSDVDESADCVLVTWDKVEGGQRYEIYQNHQGTSTVEKQMDTIVPVWTMVKGVPVLKYDPLISTLVRGDLYNWRVRARIDSTYYSKLSERETYQIPANSAVVPVEALTFDQAEYDVTVGKDIDVVLGITPDNASATTFSWATSNPAVATAGPALDGKSAVIHGVAEGSTTITVTSANGKKATFTINVKPVGTAEVSAIALDKSSVTVGVGYSSNIVATITPEGADTRLTWKSGNNDVVKVTPLDDGKSAVINGLEEGEAVITVTSANGVKATCTVTVTAATSDQVEGFVNRIYSVWLERTANTKDTADWTNKLKSGEWSGAMVAEYFVFSKESMDMERTDEEFIDALYKLLMNRDPAADPEGYAYWKGQMENGMSKYQVVASFIASPEYTSICQSYGITRGDIDMDTIGQVQQFVDRFYTLAMQRESDQAGVDYWTAGLRRNEFNGASIANNFFFSEEFAKKNTTDQQYIELLYNVMMGRASDPDGMAYWIGQINGGMIRQDVLNGFVTSPEFTAICADYGITRGL